MINRYFEIIDVYKKKQRARLSFMSIVITRYWYDLVCILNGSERLAGLIYREPEIEIKSQ